MTPTPPPQPAPQPAPDLCAALRTLRGGLLTVAAFSGFLNLLMLAPSLYMLQVYDRVLASRNLSTLAMLTLLLLGAFVLLAALEVVRTWVLVRLGARFDAGVNARVFTASYEHCLQQPGANAAQPLHDLNTLRQTLTGTALLTLFDTPWLPIYLVVIALFSAELAAFAAAGALLLGVLAWVNERLSKTRLGEAQLVGAQALQTLNNHLRHAEVIEGMGMLDGVRRRWHALHQRQLQLQAAASDQAALVSGLTRFVRLAMQSLALGVGAYLVIDGRMTAGSMIAASVLVSRALSPVEQLVGSWRHIVSGRAAWARLAALLAQHPPRHFGMALPQPQGALKLEAVSVAAPGSRALILRQLNLAIAAGESVAVLGPSGSGKSTLARVLVGVWPTSAGHVRLDGADIGRWDRGELGPHLGYLPQDIELFDGTVAENIARFGAVDADQVIAAARRAGLHELILRLPQGYDTPLGAGGSALSGGQRQRIALARALYGDPALVVLDEPNANLDEQGEAALLEALRDLRARGKTAVLITHRPASVAVADKILVLGEGAVRAFGPRDEVLAALQGKAPAVPSTSASAYASAAPGAGQVTGPLVVRHG